MTNNYVKPKSNHISHPARQLLWFVTAFLCGYLTATVFDFTSLRHWVSNNILAEDKPIKTPPATIKQDNLIKPKFEFYTLLTKEHHPSASALPKQELPPDAAATHKIPMNDTANSPPIGKPSNNPASNNDQASNKNHAQNTTPTSAHYFVQIASFKNKQEAERLKAALILKGFDINIVAASLEQGGWFRVILGPYPSKIAAQKVQVNVARSEHILGLIRKG